MQKCCKFCRKFCNKCYLLNFCANLNITIKNGIVVNQTKNTGTVRESLISLSCYWAIWCWSDAGTNSNFVLGYCHRDLGSSRISPLLCLFSENSSGNKPDSDASDIVQMIPQTMWSCWAGEAVYHLMAWLDGVDSETYWSSVMVAQGCVWREGEARRKTNAFLSKCCRGRDAQHRTLTGLFVCVLISCPARDRLINVNTGQT